MKIKSKVIITAVLSFVMALATIFGFGSLKQEKGGFNGIYAGEFTAFADGENQTEVGVVKGMLSTDGNYLLLATPLTIVDFSEYTAVGYEIVKDGQALVANGLESEGYYTGITVNTADGTATWTMEQIFGASATGMIVAEIEYSAESDYSVKPYAVKAGDKVYGAEQSIVQEKTAYRFEAECATLETTIGNIGAGLEGKTTEETCYPSGDAFVYGLTRTGTAEFTFYVTAEKDCKATLSICMGQAGTERELSEIFNIAVNDVPVSYDTSLSFKIAAANGFYDWTKMEVAVIDLDAGSNIITLTKVDTGLNFDYIELASTAQLQDTREYNDGHTYENWDVVVAPTYEQGGTVACYCSTCRDHKTDVSVPAVSVANGWTKVSSGAVSVWEYVLEQGTVSVEIEEVATKYDFAASDLTSSDATWKNDENGEYWGSSGSKTFTVTIYVEESTTVRFVLKHARSNTTYSGSTLVTMTLNGSSDNVIYNEGTVTHNGWFKWKEFSVATLSLQAGANTISFSPKANVNIVGFSVMSVIPVTLSAQ